MKQIVILSGKGGTGKTSLAAAFAHLASESPAPLRAVLADADVDAANLELVLRPERRETHDFTGGAVAVIDPERCQGCGVCQQVCRFDAIIPPSSHEKGGMNDRCRIDPIACNGCAACVYQCPEDAIRMEPQIAGQWYRSESRYGPLFHADLYPTQENSGKLVTLVKQNARLLAMDMGISALPGDESCRAIGNRSYLARWPPTCQQPGPGYGSEPGCPITPPGSLAKHRVGHIPSPGTRKHLPTCQPEDCGDL